MKPLIETNPWLKRPDAMKRLIENAADSSKFEGAKKLRIPADSQSRARSKASPKKDANGA